MTPTEAPADATEMEIKDHSEVRRPSRDQEAFNAIRIP